MTPQQLNILVLKPTLSWMGNLYDSKEARIMLIAIALQESGLLHRIQVGGPAHGLWQFERAGGVRGVMNHLKTMQTAENIAKALIYNDSETDVYTAIVDNDILACVFARLYLYTDPKPLPSTAAEGWLYYKRTWRPGKPHPETWEKHWNTATNVVNGTP